MSNLPGGAFPTWSGERGRPAFKKRYVAIALVALLLGGVGLLAGVKGDWFGPAEPSDGSGAVEVDNSEQVLQEAKKLEKMAIAQLQQMSKNKPTEEGLDEVIRTWKNAKTVLRSVSAESAEYQNAKQELETYESQCKNIYHYTLPIARHLYGS